MDNHYELKRLSALRQLNLLDTAPSESFERITESREITPQETGILEDLAAMVMAQIELQHAFGRVDPVTGLPNRSQLPRVTC